MKRLLLLCFAALVTLTAFAQDRYVTQVLFNGNNGIMQFQRSAGLQTIILNLGTADDYQKAKFVPETGKLVFQANAGYWDSTYVSAIRAADDNQKFSVVGDSVYYNVNGTRVFAITKDGVVNLGYYKNNVALDSVLIVDNNGQLKQVHKNTIAPPLSVDYVNDIPALESYSGNARTVIVRDSVRGGVFSRYDSNIAVDSIIYFDAAGVPGTNRWGRDWDHATVRVGWAGIKGDGTDESWLMNKIINTFSNATGDKTGIGILVTAGTYKFRNIIVKKGIKIFSNQVATNNVNAYVPAIIFPAPGADYVFDFEEASMNATLDGLYINGDYTNNPNLIAAVRFRGAFNSIFNCNIIFCPNHAVWSSCGSFRIINNNFQGMFAPNIPFTGYEDFHGALHITAAGDSYLIGNEVGAAAPYLTGQVPNPIDILRDPTYKRIVSMFAGYLGNSYVENNLFENGDQGAVINGGLYGNYKGNRYEMNGFRGLRLRNFYYGTFTDEKFSNNSLAINGGGEDLRLDTGAVGFCRWSKPVFVRLTHPSVPTSTFKVKYNVVNYSGDENYIDGPVWAVETARYDSLGHYDTSLAGIPMKKSFYQRDPQNPLFNSVEAGWTGAEDGIVRGGVRVSTGTSAAEGSRVGTIGFYGPDHNVQSQIGFNNDGNLNFDLFGTNKQFVFGNGTGVFAKPGPNSLSVQSNDPMGKTVSFNLYTTPTQNKVGIFALDSAGTLNITATNNMGFNLGAPGGYYTFIGGGFTIARAGGVPFTLIGDGTGFNQFHMSSDGSATHALDFTLNNATGGASITSGDTITVGLSKNMKFAVNGLTYIGQSPNPRYPTDYNFRFLGRDTTTGEIVHIGNTYWDSTQVKNYLTGSYTGKNIYNSDGYLTSNRFLKGNSGSNIYDLTIDSVHNFKVYSRENNQVPSGIDLRGYKTNDVTTYGSINASPYQANLTMTAGNSQISRILVNNDSSVLIRTAGGVKPVTDQFIFKAGKLTIPDYSNNVTEDSVLTTDVNGKIKQRYMPVTAPPTLQSVLTNGNLYSSSTSTNLRMDATSSPRNGYVQLMSYSNPTDVSAVMTVGTTRNSAATVETASFGTTSIATVGNASESFFYFASDSNKIKIGTNGGRQPELRVVKNDGVNPDVELNRFINGRLNGLPAQNSNEFVTRQQVTDTSNARVATMTLDKVLANGNLTSRVGNFGGLGSSGPVNFSGGLFISSIAVTSNTSLSVGTMVVYADNTGGTITLTLPQASLSAGLVVYIKKRSAGGNDVVVDGNASETIDGALTQTLTTQYSSYTLHCDGTKWSIF